MAGGAVSLPRMSVKQNQDLLNALALGKLYPYKFKVKKLINGANFSKSDSAGGGSYFSLAWTPQFKVGIVYLNPTFIITPNSGTGTFAIIVSYASVITMGDNASPTAIDLEGTDIFAVLFTGGSVNELVSVAPNNWYLETNKTLYLHIWADSTSVAAANLTIQGQFTYGTLLTQEQ